jgi:hypothetical protein
MTRSPIVMRIRSTDRMAASIRSHLSSIMPALKTWR